MSPSRSGPDGLGNSTLLEPVFCADGGAAVDAFRDTRPDLVLLDLMLPGRDGIDVCRAIRAETVV